MAETYANGTTDIPEIFGSLVFNDQVMRERLPKNTYRAVQKTIQNGTTLDLDVANVVAAVMKEWAVEHGATHYTHWFQPLTGLTAEKHDSFIEPTSDGRVIMEFSGKELVKGEPDASSFPSGGLRATFEARGYTAWDPSSPAFIKDGSLYIPTAFCSYGGEVLDKKTPLLRSMESLSHSAVRVLRLLGRTDVVSVETTLGAEQEYFLIDKDLYLQRKDLMLCGRTLIGAPSPKGQEMADHYFGVIKPRVAEYMHDLDRELWKLGVPAKTKHNEVAPSQHELAPVYESANVAVDHNQLTMEMMKKIADRHGMACLLHEKPFAGVNGSGKHNNWSISTDRGENLLDPGRDPGRNLQFLTFLICVISAVDEYGDLMRISVASASNDNRLGGNEAPPAIISIFIGDDLQAVLDALERGETYEEPERSNMGIGVSLLPSITKDTTDRNRTSPFAFTGNKFEFRMPGSSLSLAGPNVVLNTAVAEALDGLYAHLQGTSQEQMKDALLSELRAMLKAHKKVIFNGNGYTSEWVAEAKRRGLYNFSSLPEAVPHLMDRKNVDLFEKHGVFSEKELHSRYEIFLENYTKSTHIEAVTMIEMVKKDFTCGLVDYLDVLTDEYARKKQLLPEASFTYEENLLKTLNDDENLIEARLIKLEKDTARAEKMPDLLKQATFYHNTILKDMASLREAVDSAEAYIPEKYLPYPTYEELLFSTR